MRCAGVAPPGTRFSTGSCAARATRRVTPSMAGMAGNGKARGEVAMSMRRALRTCSARVHGDCAASGLDGRVARHYLPLHDAANAPHLACDPDRVVLAGKQRFRSSDARAGTGFRTGNGEAGKGQRSSGKAGLGAGRVELAASRTRERGARFRACSDGPARRSGYACTSGRGASGGCPDARHAAAEDHQRRRQVCG